MNVCSCRAGRPGWATPIIEVRNPAGGARSRQGGDHRRGTASGEAPPEHNEAWPAGERGRRRAVVLSLPIVPGRQRWRDPKRVKTALMDPWLDLQVALEFLVLVKDFPHVGPPCGNTDGATPRVEPPQFAGIGSLRLSDVPASVRLQAASRASRCCNAPSRFRPNARERLVRTPLGSGCTVARLQPCRGSPPSVAAICGRAKSRRELQFCFFWKRCSTGGFSKPTSQPHCRIFLFVIVPAPRGHCKMSGGARFPLP